MMAKTTTLLLGAAATWSATAQAAPTIYTSQAAFLAATTNQATDRFNELRTDTPTASPQTRTIGGYSYTVAAPRGLYGALVSGASALSAFDSRDTIVFDGFSPEIRGVGAAFFETNVTGAFLLGDILVTVVDADGTTSQTIVDAMQSGFLGFVSSGAISSLSVTGVQRTGNGFLFPTVDDLILAQVAVTAVPEPATWLTLFVGLAMVAGSARYRRRRTSVRFG